MTPDGIRDIADRMDAGDAFDGIPILLREAADAIARLSEQVEKQGKVVEAAREMLYVAPYFRSKSPTAPRPDDMVDLRVRMKDLSAMSAALNGLVVVGEDGDDVGLHRPEADDARVVDPSR